MDQLQLIIQNLELEGDNKVSAFFQIKFLEIRKDGQDDEVMAIILDIS